MGDVEFDTTEWDQLWAWPRERASTRRSCQRFTGNFGGLLFLQRNTTRMEWLVATVR